MNGRRRIQCINQGMIVYNRRNWQTTAMSNSCWMRKIFLWTYNGVTHHHDGISASGEEDESQKAALNEYDGCEPLHII